MKTCSSSHLFQPFTAACHQGRVRAKRTKFSGRSPKPSTHWFTFSVLSSISSVKKQVQMIKTKRTKIMAVNRIYHLIFHPTFCQNLLFCSTNTPRDKIPQKTSGDFTQPWSPWWKWRRFLLQAVSINGISTYVRSLTWAVWRVNVSLNVYIYIYIDCLGWSEAETTLDVICSNRGFHDPH